MDNLLQVSLDKNLQEIKQRCLDDLRHFVKELDEVLKAKDPRKNGTGNVKMVFLFFFLQPKSAE